MPPTLALVDASGYLYRAFYAIPRMTGPGGRPTNATLGFANMIRKLRADRKPDAIAVCFDRAEKTFRHEMDAAYKAQRQAMPDDLAPQIDDTKRLCRALGLAVVEEPGYEADDLIAALAVRAADAGMRVEVASADKDLFQLVKGDEILVWHPTQERLLDAAGVEEVFGVPPERVVDVLAIMGDSSDNIPGVKGIGEKGARELVKQFGSLDEIYAHVGEVTGKKRTCLEEGKADAFRSRELALLRKDAPVGEERDAASLLARFTVPPLDERREALAAVFDELGFTKLKQELLGSSTAAGGAPALEAPTAAKGAAEPPARWEADPTALAALAAAAKRAPRAGIALEWKPGAPFPPQPLVAAVAFPGGETVAFSLASPAGKETLAALFASAPLVAHDSKRLHVAASLLGIAPPKDAADVMLASYVCAPGIHGHDLAGASRALLSRAPETIPSLSDVFGKAGFGAPEEFNSDAGLAYLGCRARLPLALTEALETKLGSGALRRVLLEIEAPLVPVLARMELAGVLVDRGVLAQLSKDFERRLVALEGKIHEAAGEPFNVGSPSQLGKILFEKLGYPVLKKTSKTKSYATDSDVLSELAAREVGPLPALVLEWRELSKLKGTYVDALPLHIAADGRIHTRYDQAVAATGRLSSNDPNLQNIPIRSETGREIRKAFVAPEGSKLVVADYSQIELRLLAHLSGDEALREVFRQGEDIHRATAARIFGIDPASVTHDQRRSAKTINFGILYGMGPFALAGQLGVPQAEAKKFIAAYFERFPGIRAFLDGILAQARATGCTETIFGRLRPIPGLADRNFAVRSNAERMAMNAPFQGAAADLVKRAMIALDAALAARAPSTRLLLQVHDELVVESPEKDVPRVSEILKEAMEGAGTLSVPLTVEVGAGRNWGEAKG